MSECMHRNTSIWFEDSGEKWNCCKDCGRYLYDRELRLYRRLSKLQDENAKLREAHSRNTKEYCKYEDIGHRCGWRVLAEAMQQRSKAALLEEK